MHISLKKHCFMAIVYFVAMSVATGLLYPLATTAAARIFFPERSRGALIEIDGVLVGAENVGQPFSSPRHFWGRPSATADMPYNAASSGGSNLSPTNPELLRTIEERVALLRRAHGAGPVPVELATASGSGLDPHISPAAARYQAARVARENRLEQAEVEKLIDRQVEGRQYFLFGEPRVNVLRLNLALEEVLRDGKASGGAKK